MRLTDRMGSGAKADGATAPKTGKLTGQPVRSEMHRGGKREKAHTTLTVESAKGVTGLAGPRVLGTREDGEERS